MKDDKETGFLCVTLRVGESVKIGENIEIVYIKRYSAGQMGIGIKAPKTVKLERQKKKETNG